MFLKRYLEVVQCSREASLDDLILSHLRVFKYNNTWLLRERLKGSEGRPDSVVADMDLLEKMILSGGYCFQHVELLKRTLDELGFETTRHACLSLYSPTLDEEMMKLKVFPHALLIVFDPRKREKVVVDVGFGRNVFFGGVPLSRMMEGLSEPFFFGGDQYIIHEVPNFPSWRRVEVFLQQQWMPMFVFDVQNSFDQEELNRYNELLLSYPRPVFAWDTRYLLAWCGEEKGKSTRRWLIAEKGQRFALHKMSLGGHLEVDQKIESWDELQKTAQNVFHVTLDPIVQDWMMMEVK